MRSNTKFATLKRLATPVNATAVLTGSQISSGLITSTSPAPVTMTLPTATILATNLQAKRGDDLLLIIDNTVGASVVTIALGTGITTVAIPAITGGGSLAVAVGEMGFFRFYFSSTTTAKIARTI